MSQAMADICTELESQNKRLRREQERLNAELVSVRMEQEQAAKLLPEYRLEIVRSRSLAEVAQNELQVRDAQLFRLSEIWNQTL